MGKRMGRPKTDKAMVLAIWMIAANPPETARTRGDKIGPQAVRAELLKLADGLPKRPRGRVPSERTIGTYLREFWALSEEEQRPYRYFRWPESMEFGALPWEAGASALELLRWRRERKYARPLLGQVRWFFRVSTLAPDAPFEDRYEAARWLFAFEAAGNPPIGEDMKRQVELWLAFTPWRSSADAEAYTTGLWGKVLAFPHGVSVAMRDFGPGAGVLGDFLVALDPFGVPEESLRGIAKPIEEALRGTAEPIEDVLLGVAEQMIQDIDSEDKGGSQCEDTFADEAANGSPSPASGTTKAAGESNSGSAASPPRRPRRKN